MKQYFFVILILMGLNSCLTAGTHGLIKGYEYPVSKYVLGKVVFHVISNSPNINRDTAKDYYNDGESYITIEITKGEVLNRYTVHFYGDKVDWDTSKTSQISISYAYDNDGNGGSEGNGGFPWYKSSLKKKLISIFESEFINKIDKELRQNPIITE